MQKIIALVIAGWATSASALTLNPKRTIELRGMVDESTLLLAAAVEMLAQESTDPIDIVIDSPGGMVTPTHYLLNAMEAAKGRGVVFRCAVINMAMSAAFFVFANCNERYALPWAMLMWHPISQRIRSVNADEAEMIATELRQADAAFKLSAVRAMRVSGDFYDLHSVAETKWIASSLAMVTPKFMRIVSTVQPGNLFQHLIPQGGTSGGSPTIRTP